MIYLKENVRIKVISDYLSLIFNALMVVSEIIKKPMWITSANDSKHRKGSAHFKNRAIDVRTRHLDMREFCVLSAQLSHFDNIKLILFEWKEKVDGKWIKHKANFDNDNYYDEFVRYLNCKNIKVSHLHVEW